MLQKGLLIVFSLLTVSPVYGQDCGNTVKGLVEDAQGEELPGATVIVESTDRGTVSDEHGEFELSGLCPGQYTLLIRYVGFEDQRMVVRVPSSRQQIIQMRASVKVLHDIVVEGAHSQTHGLSQSISILSEDELIAVRGKALGEMLQQVPGVTNIMSGPGVFKPVIHGLHSQRILLLNNGLRQEGQQWGVDHAPEIDPFVASEIEVVRGPEAVRYGPEAMGGVIIINSAPLHYSSGVGGELNVGFSSNNRMGVFSGALEGGFRKPSAMSWRIQGTVKRGGDYHSPEYNLSNTGTREYNVSASSGWKKDNTEVTLFVSSFNTQIGILRSAHSGSLSDLQSSIVNERPWYIRKFTYEINSPRQQVGHHLVKVTLDTELHSAGRLRVVYGGQYNDRREFDIRRDRQDIPALSLDLFTHSLDVSLDHSRNRLSGTLGVNATFRDNNNQTGIGLLPDYTQYTAGLFLFEKYRRGKWIHELGARLDHQVLQPRMFLNRVLLTPSYNFTFGSATLGSAVYLGERSRLSANVGMTTRAPLVNEMFSQGLHHGSAAIEEGLMLRDDMVITDRSAIRNERSWKSVTTFQHFSDRFSFEVSGYLNYFDNYIYLSPYESRLTIRGYFPVFQYRQTDAILAGGDIFGEVKLSERLSYSGKASYVMAENRRSSDRLPLIPPAEIENDISYTIPGIGNWKNIRTRILSRSTTRQVRAPRTIYPNEVAGKDIGGTFDFMPPPDAYTLFGMDITGHFTVGNRELTLNVAVDNLFNKSYRNYLNRLRYFADETGRNISIRLNYKFHTHD